MGHGFLATFNGGTRAVRCASEIASAASALGLEVRTGLHSGEFEVRGDDIAGIAVASPSVSVTWPGRDRYS